jgi:hypothetical protein
MTPSIRTLEEHEVALRRLEELMTKDSAAVSPDDQELNELAERIEEFEKRTFRLDVGTAPLSP